MATLIDMLDGAFPAVLTLRLSTAPLVQPASLENIVEASFAGYAPAALVTIGRAPPAAGWGYVSGYGQFFFNGLASEIRLTAVYLTAYDRRDNFLLYAMSVVGTPYEVMRPGSTTFYVDFAANVYVPPG